MRLEKWASFAEIVGAFAIVLTLVFVGYEVRQNTRAQEAATYQELVRDVREVTQTVPIAIRNKMRRGEELADDERSIFVQWFGGTMRAYENWWQQHELGRIDDEAFEAYISHLGITLMDPYSREFWHTKAWVALPGFEEYVNEHIRNNPIGD